MALFVLKRGNRPDSEAHTLCLTAEKQLCLWTNEDTALAYADNHSYAKWRVIPANSLHFASVGRIKHNKFNQTRPCYVFMDAQTKDAESMAKKIASPKLLVEVFEDHETRRCGISSRADCEDTFLDELTDALQMTADASTNWKTRLHDLLPIVVDICCKYRGYKVESVIERRELIAGDLDLPRST